jgi:hypothetical protein
VIRHVVVPAICVDDCIDSEKVYKVCDAIFAGADAVCQAELREVRSDLIRPLVVLKGKRSNHISIFAVKFDLRAPFSLQASSPGK